MTTTILSNIKIEKNLTVDTNYEECNPYLINYFKEKNPQLNLSILKY